ncbi:helix-turn-helix domain containing protein [Azospirillum canadense]|uniref:helix-turn-helix domain containing protein n=1 Tax=Azospirillum canadense TaxID=403962 RepID=UPI00222641D9|nr:helix-turn-helix domain containing protein [Azospirillum canadense]MCW2242243.1 hypothetical protein [Azospirillum canadense]
MAAKKFMNGTEYATHCGVTKMTVSRWTKRDGFPIKDGKIDVAAADAWREANLDASKPRSSVNPAAAPPAAAAKPTRKTPVPTPTAPESPADLPPDLAGAVLLMPDGTQTLLAEIPSFAASQAAKMYYDAEMKKREVLAHDKEHIPKVEVLAATETMVSMFRAEFMGLGRRVAPMLEGKPLAERADIIQDQARTVLERMARKITAAAQGDFDEQADADGDEDGDADPAERG